MRTAKAPRNRGFTLVELLIVIGILLPAVTAARREGNRIKCLSNLRNMAMAQWTYVIDNRGWLVQGGMAHGSGADANEEATWFNTLNRYYNNKLVARCPSDTSIYWDQPMPGSTTQLRRTSYGINAFLDHDLCPWGPGFGPVPPGGLYVKIEQIRHASDVVQFVEMAYSGEYAAADHVHPNLFALATTPDAAVPARVAGQMQSNAHGPRRARPSGDDVSNCTFIDGHAESARVSDIFRNLYVNRFDPAAPQPRP